MQALISLFIAYLVNKVIRELKQEIAWKALFISGMLKYKFRYVKIFLWYVRILK